MARQSQCSFVLMAATLGALPFGGCTTSSVLPPAASSSALTNPAPRVGNAGRRPQVAGLPASIPTPGRNAWQPNAKARDWKYIVIHHTATNSGSVESIHESHLKNKDKNGNPWLGIGYHFVIGNGAGMPDGAIEPTFRWRTQIQGAHAGSQDKAYNELGIGVCLVGDFEKSPPTPAQRRAVKLLVQSLKSDYHISSANVVGHKDIRASATECPGKFFNMADVAADVPALLFGFDQQGEPVERFAASPGSILQ
ncbi:MAG: peptidoglycan recognition protein family protein [Planctomycetaceae bacterium]